jgi:hypothetical protein
MQRSRRADGADKYDGAKISYSVRRARKSAWTISILAAKFHLECESELANAPT